MDDVIAVYFVPSAIRHKAAGGACLLFKCPAEPSSVSRGGRLGRIMLTNMNPSGSVSHVPHWSRPEMEARLHGPCALSSAFSRHVPTNCTAIEQYLPGLSLGSMPATCVEHPTDRMEGQDCHLHTGSRQTSTEAVAWLRQVTLVIPSPLMAADRPPFGTVTANVATTTTNGIKSGSPCRISTDGGGKLTP